MRKQDAPKDQTKTRQTAQEKIADSVTDIIASESAAGHENIQRISWFGLGVVLLALVYVTINTTMDVSLKIFAMVALIYVYQCIVVVVSTVARISQKTASILGILAMFAVTYEESGLNVMRAFFDGVSKAAESSATDNKTSKN